MQLPEPLRSQYLEAHNKEVNGHYENGTWTPCELLDGVTPIDTKEVFTRKVNPDGSIRVKSRIVAR